MATKTGEGFLSRFGKTGPSDVTQGELENRNENF